MKHLPTFLYQTIPHKRHRFSTVGDYYKKDGCQYFKVSKMNADYEALVFVHEFVEWFLTEKRGIKEKDILKFDIQFEKEREQGKHSIMKEPGFDKQAPYIREHTFATKIEKLVAKELGIDWNVYDKYVMEL